MKIRGRNGNEFEADDEAARQLIATGDYVAADKDVRKPSASTAVKPLTTADLPKAPKKGKRIK